MVPMTPGLRTGAPTRAGSGSTKPTISTPSSWRRSKISRARSTAAGLVPTSSSRSRGRTWRLIHSNAMRQPMTSVMTSDGGDHEDAAADHQRRQPEVERRQNERRRGERLQDADEQLAPIGEQPQVVQIGVVQTRLRDRGDEQRLVERRRRSASISQARVAETEIRRRDDGDARSAPSRTRPA